MNAKRPISSSPTNLLLDKLSVVEMTEFAGSWKLSIVKSLSAAVILNSNIYVGRFMILHHFRRDVKKSNSDMHFPSYSNMFVCGTNKMSLLFIFF